MSDYTSHSVAHGQVRSVRHPHTSTITSAPSTPRTASRSSPPSQPSLASRNDSASIILGLSPVKSPSKAAQSHPEELLHHILSLTRSASQQSQGDQCDRGEIGDNDEDKGNRATETDSPFFSLLKCTGSRSRNHCHQHPSLSSPFGHAEPGSFPACREKSHTVVRFQARKHKDGRVWTQRVCRKAEEVGYSTQRYMEAGEGSGWPGQGREGWQAGE